MKKKERGEPPAPSQASAAPEAYPADLGCVSGGPRALPGQLMEPQGSFWAQVWRDRAARSLWASSHWRPEPRSGCRRWDTPVLEAGGWTGDNDADADRRMQGGAGQASARREGRQEEGRRGAGVGPAQASLGSRAPDRGPAALSLRWQWRAWACGPSCRPHQAHTNKVAELKTK